MKSRGKAALLCLLLSFLLLWPAAGCEKAKEQGSGGTAVRYAARHNPLEYREQIQTACFAEDRLIYDSVTSAVLTVKSDPDSPIRREPREREYSFQTLFSAGLDGNEAAELTAFTEFQIECTQDGARWHNIRQMAAAPDGTLRLLTRRQGEWNDAGWPAHLLILDGDGQVRQDIFLENREFPGSRRALACDAAGNTYLYDDGYQSGTTIVINPQGEILGTLSGELQGGLARQALCFPDGLRFPAGHGILHNLPHRDL